MRSMRRDNARRKAALGKNDNKWRIEHAYGRNRRRGDGFFGVHADRAASFGARALRRALMRFNLVDDATHRFDGETRIRASRGFGGEHDAIRAVENGVGHVAGLSPRRTRILDHRLEHLGGRDDRASHAIGERDDLFLRDRHLFEREFHTQVTARNHHRVRRAQDFFDVLQRDVLLDLGDDEHRLRNQKTHLLDVVGATHKAQRQRIEVMLHGELEISAIFFCKRRRRHGDAGEVHPLVAGERTAVQHGRRHAR